MTHALSPLGYRDDFGHLKRCNHVEPTASAAIRSVVLAHFLASMVEDRAIPLCRRNVPARLKRAPSSARKSSLLRAKNLAVNSAYMTLNLGSAPDKAASSAGGGGGREPILIAFIGLPRPYKRFSCFFFSRRTTRAKVLSWRISNMCANDGDEKPRLFRVSNFFAWLCILNLVDMLLCGQGEREPGPGVQLKRGSSQLQRALALL